MSGINLLPKEIRQGQAYTSLQRTVYSLTSSVLVVFIVVVAGVLGWWVYLSQTSISVSNEMSSVIAQIQQETEAEQLAIQLYSRSVGAQAFLTGRQTTADLASLVLSDPEVVVQSWDFSGGGVQAVEVQASNVEAIESYTANLSKTYRVVIDTLEQGPDAVWVANMTLQSSVPPEPTP